MNKKAQLEQWSTLVADTGDITSIEQHQPHDATTNPSLLLATAENTDFQHLLDDARRLARDLYSQPSTTHYVEAFAAITGHAILAHIPGVVSTEVDARLSFDMRGTLEQARRVIATYQTLGVSRERILIKVAATWEGIRAAQVLEQEGIGCNVTLVFGLHQAQAAAEAGATLISPFVGRIHDWHLKHGGIIDTIHDDPGVQSVKNIYHFYKSHGLDTVIMGASFRNTDQIEALSGCDRLTISPSLLTQLESESTPLSRQLRVEDITLEDDVPALTEAAFRFQLNQDAMATDLLSDGIRRFAHDQVKLEQVLAIGH